MEIIENKTPAPAKRAIVSAANIYLGSVLILSGLIWMFYNLDVVGRRFFTAVFSWEMLLVAAGGYLLALRRWALGGIVTAAGLLFVLSKHFGFHIPVGEIILPCVLIALGVAFLIPRK